VRCATAAKRSATYLLARLAGAVMQMPAMECCVASSSNAGAGRSDQCGDVGLAV